MCCGPHGAEHVTRACTITRHFQVILGLEAKIMEEHDVGEESWGESNRTEWRGLGLTDPIKKVEVSDLKTCSVHCA